MSPPLEVDIDALNADAGRLQSLGHPFKPSNCAPPGSDSISLGAARVLSLDPLKNRLFVGVSG